MPEWYDTVWLPPGTVTGVVVRRPGYEVLAAAIDDKRGRRRWYGVSGVDLRPLTWYPEAWRPADAKRWRWPNGTVPPSLPVLVMPQLATTAPVFDATEAAAEMEAEREDARRNRIASEIGEVQWWRDVTRVRYEPMGEISREMGEARIMRHLVMERSIPIAHRRQKSNAAVVADIKRTWEDIYGEHPRDADWIPPMPLQPEDDRDFLTVLRWFAEVLPGRRDMRILRARTSSPPSPWMLIGDEIGMTGLRARRSYNSVVDSLISAGNRIPRYAPMRMDDVRERNRAAKRG